ncbi:hypothetical protein V8F06_014342 [Rhypophila decipiens]
MDYGSSACFLKLPKRLLTKFTQVQAIGARAVVGAFRTVACPIAEAEAGIEPVDIRLHRQTRQFCITSHTLPRKISLLALVSQCFVLHSTVAPRRGGGYPDGRRGADENTTSLRGYYVRPRPYSLMDP